MNDNDIFIKISEQLGSLNANMTLVLNQLSQHNTRITELEKKNCNKDDSFKSKIIELLTKCLIISLSSIGVLVGASEIITKILH